MTTHIVDNRIDALRIGYEATEWGASLDFDCYVDLLKDWRVRLIERDGVGIGALFQHDGEVHVSIAPQWRKRWATPGLLRQIFDGMTKTRVSVGHDYMYAILERLGFRRDGAWMIKG